MMRSKKIVALFGALVAVTSGLSGAVLGSGVAAAAPDCPKMYVIAIPGTWETSDHKHRPSHGMLAGVTEGLPGDIRADYVTYAATAFPWEGNVYGKSRAEAVKNGNGMIARMAAACPGAKIGIVGYSQGADAAGDIAADIGSGHGVIPADRVVAVGLLSDPSRSPGDAQIGPRAGGAGAEGPRPGGFGYLSLVTRTICRGGGNPDLYCATASDDYATRFAGFMAQVSEMNPAKLWSYQQEFGSIMGDLMNGGGVSLLQSQFTDAANARRARELQKFYNTGAHTDYASYDIGGGETAPEWLHNYLIQQAG
jgi:hypothetical protein